MNPELFSSLAQFVSLPSFSKLTYRFNHYDARFPSHYLNDTRSCSFNQALNFCIFATCYHYCKHFTSVVTQRRNVNIKVTTAPPVVIIKSSIQLLSVLHIPYIFFDYPWLSPIFLITSIYSLIDLSFLIAMDLLNAKASAPVVAISYALMLRGHWIWKTLHVRIRFVACCCCFLFV